MTPLLVVRQVRTLPYHPSFAAWAAHMGDCPVCVCRDRWRDCPEQLALKYALDWDIEQQTAAAAWN